MKKLFGFLLGLITVSTSILVVDTASACPANSTYSSWDGSCLCNAGYAPVTINSRNDTGQYAYTSTTVVCQKETNTISSVYFSDIFTDNPYLSAIATMKNKGIISGYSDGTFKPNNPINRAEFTKIIVGLLTSTPNGSNCFKDVKNEWFAPHVCYAKANGIIGGYKDGTFKPSNNINLAEALKIMLAALKTPLSANMGTNWYDVYVNTANDLKLLSTINADITHNITRVEMAELIYRLKYGYNAVGIPQ